MNIEHVKDNNMLTKEIGVTDMIELQQALVADHIANLEREGSALRAERERDHGREHTADGATDGLTHPADIPSRRVRLGRWLVTVGERVAGARPTATDLSRSITATGGDDPCGDDRLAPAA